MFYHSFHPARTFSHLCRSGLKSVWRSRLSPHVGYLRRMADGIYLVIFHFYVDYQSKYLLSVALITTIQSQPWRKYISGLIDCHTFSQGRGSHQWIHFTSWCYFYMFLFAQLYFKEQTERGNSHESDLKTGLQIFIGCKIEIWSTDSSQNDNNDWTGSSRL